MIRRLAAIAMLTVGISAQPAGAEPAPPKAGDILNLVPQDWSKQTWSMGAPSNNDAAGKIVIHWFCTPKVQACADDLSRLVTMRDTGNVYIIAYINGSMREAKKLDPIRDSEGVGRGTVATGAGVKKLFKQLGIAKGPWSIVVDVDGTVKAVTTSGDLNELDARDALVKQLAEAVRPYVVVTDGVKTARVGEPMKFGISIKLSPWSSATRKAPLEFTLTAAKEVKCDSTTLRGDQIKIEGRLIQALVTCTAPRGSFEARGELRFGYVSASGAQGLGAESATWKFDVKP